jgi:hypothetical protein
MGREANKQTSGAIQMRDATHEVWRASDLQRQYRRVLDEAKQTPQQVIDSDGEMLCIWTLAETSALVELRDYFSALAQFQAAYAHHRSDAPHDWAPMTPYPFIASLPPADVEEFARELLAYTLKAAQDGQTDELDGVIEAWRSTALAYESPEILDAITAPIDYDAIEEILPPSEEQVAAHEASGQSEALS